MEIGDVYILRHERIPVMVLAIDMNLIFCRYLADGDDCIRGGSGSHSLSELVSVRRFCEEWSDAMTTLASIANRAPVDQPNGGGHSIVWAFWHVGQQAKETLRRWGWDRWIATADERRNDPHA